MPKEYLIVGFGLAGLAFTSVLERNQKSFHVIDNNHDNASRVIGGMYNPIILKRFTPAWQAHNMWEKSISTYQYFEQKFNKKYFQPFHIYRILQSVEEQNNWTVASDKVVMNKYMLTDIQMENIEGIYAPYGFGELKNVGRVEGEQIMKDYKEYLSKKNLFSKETFEYSKLIFGENYVEYKGEQYQQVVFSEGSLITENPFFNYLPMKVSKGEMLIVEIPDLQLDKAIKSSCFMVPLGNQMFIVGATYNWEDKTFNLTNEGKADLEEKLTSFLKLPYKILDYKAGIRPTVSDRRPLLGRHPVHSQLAVLNGLGTRGIIYAPALAEILYDHLEKDVTIDSEMNINRFESLLQSSN